MAKPKKSVVSFRNRLEATFKTMPSETLRVGFSDLDMWVGMGNYAMNRINSGRFDVAWMFGRNYVLYGESGSGKSLYAAMIAAEAQRQHNALVIWIDVEKATDDEAGKKWLKRAGLNMDELIYLSAAGLEEIKRTIAEVAGDIRANFRKEDGKDIQPVVIVVDSWAAAQPKSQLERTQKGELVGDQGQKAKQTGEVILSTTHLCSGIPLMVIGIQHVMDNQDGYGRKHKTTGGNKMIFYASGCMLYTKRELRAGDVEDTANMKQLQEVYSDWSANLKKDVGLHKDGDIVGISIVAEVLKSRVAKPFQRIEVQVPFKFGMDKYSGLFEVMLLEQQIWPAKSAGYFEYEDPEAPEDKETGNRYVKFHRNKFRDHADRIMALAPVDVSDPEAAQKMTPTEEELDQIPDLEEVSQEIDQMEDTLKGISKNLDSMSDEEKAEAVATVEKIGKKAKAGIEKVSKAKA